jgi:hypothetical protein
MGGAISPSATGFSLLMRYRVTYLFWLMVWVALLSTGAAVLKLSGSAALMVFGVWAAVFSFFVLGEMKRD